MKKMKTNAELTASELEKKRHDTMMGVFLFLILGNLFGFADHYEVLSANVVFLSQVIAIAFHMIALVLAIKCLKLKNQVKAKTESV